MRRKGFTMLEILIVIIIIAILATFAIPQYLKASRRAIAAEAVTGIGSIRGALARYFQEHNKLTKTIADLDVDDPGKVKHSNFSYTIPSTSSPEVGSSGIGLYKIKAEGKSASRADGIDVCYDYSDNTIKSSYPSDATAVECN